MRHGGRVRKRRRIVEEPCVFVENEAREDDEEDELQESDNEEEGEVQESEKEDDEESEEEDDDELEESEEDDDDELDESEEDDDDESDPDETTEESGGPSENEEAIAADQLTLRKLGDFLRGGGSDGSIPQSVIDGCTCEGSKHYRPDLQGFRERAAWWLQQDMEPWPKALLTALLFIVPSEWGDAGWGALALLDSHSLLGVLTDPRTVCRRTLERERTFPTHLLKEASLVCSMSGLRALVHTIARRKAPPQGLAVLQGRSKVLHAADVYWLLQE